MKILVAHDGSAQSGRALDQAATLAGKFGGAITVLNVVPDLCLSSEEIGPSACEAVTGSLQKDAAASMRKVTQALEAKGIQAEVIIKDGHPADQILDTAEEIGADLIVIGSTGKHGAKRFLMGSVSGKVAAHAGRNVFIVK